jgi:hypothetical protein
MEPFLVPAAGAGTGSATALLNTVGGVTWMYLASYAPLLRAELNSEIERQMERD